MTSEPPAPLGVFAGYGIEIEYMIVDRASLAVAPVCDRVLQAVTGEIRSEVEQGELAWSNELVAHVIELKTNGPAPALEPLPDLFQRDLHRVDEIAESVGARLMPSAMHPWMDPHTETRLWPHEQNEIYAAFDRIFGCKGHGWANLQSVHINLPFADDEEFGRLHAAIRLVLPILPALAASSPFADGRLQRWRDTRMEFYRGNALKIPSVTGKVIPEAVYTRADYENRLLQPIYHDLAPYDPEGILQEEWVNARGAIARFDRNAIEIRVLDVQECPRMDLAIAALVVATLQALVAEQWMDYARQRIYAVDALAAILDATIEHAEDAVIEDRAYLDAFRFPAARRATAAALWEHIAAQLDLNALPQTWQQPLSMLFEHGTLATRLLRAAGPGPDRKRLQRVYRELCDCLAADRALT